MEFDPKIVAAGRAADRAVTRAEIALKRMVEALAELKEANLEVTRTTDAFRESVLGGTGPEDAQ
jgi:hypothetical protein